MAFFTRPIAIEKSFVGPAQRAEYIPGSPSNKLIHNPESSAKAGLPEDFEAIFSWTKKWPENIFDTQLANAFLGGKYSVGYQELVSDRLP